MHFNNLSYINEYLCKYCTTYLFFEYSHVQVNRSKFIEHALKN